MLCEELLHLLGLPSGEIVRGHMDLFAARLVEHEVDKEGANSAEVHRGAVLTST